MGHVATRGAPAMPTPRKAIPPTTEAIDQFCSQFDVLFGRSEEREAVRQYLIGLRLPREHNKTIVELAAIVPGARRQALHHFLHDAPSRQRRAQRTPAGVVAGASLAAAA